MEQISFIVGSHYLITIQETDADYFKDVKKRLYDGKTRIRSFGTDYLCYALLDTLVDSYIINLEILGAAIEECGRTILEADAKVIEDLYHYKTELSYIRKTYVHSKKSQPVSLTVILPSKPKHVHLFTRLG